MSGYYGTNAFNAKALQLGLPSAFNNRQDPKHARSLNAWDYRNELDLITHQFISRFKWSGEVLKKFTPQYIERNLFYYGYVIAFMDDEYGFMILPGNVIGYNVFNEPTLYHVWGLNFNRDVPADQCVVIRDNAGSTPVDKGYSPYRPYNVFNRYAMKISDIQRTLEVYSNAMKKPVLVVSNFEKSKSVQRVIDNINENEFYAVIDQQITNPKETVFYQSDHNANDLNGINMYKQSLFNEMQMRLGITPNFANKNAYQSEEEVNHKNAVAEFNLQSTFKCREEAVEQIKEIMGEDIKCENLVDQCKPEQPDSQEDDPLFEGK